MKLDLELIGPNDSETATQIVLKDDSDTSTYWVQFNSRLAMEHQPQSKYFD